MNAPLHTGQVLLQRTSDSIRRMAIYGAIRGADPMFIFAFDLSSFGGDSRERIVNVPDWAFRYIERLAHIRSPRNIMPDSQREIGLYER